jgi:hypothetical protein
MTIRRVRHLLVSRVSRQRINQRIKADFSNESFSFDLAVAVLIIIGAVVGFFLFTLYPGKSRDTKGFMGTYEFAVWRVLLAATGALCGALIPSVIASYTGILNWPKDRKYNSSRLQAGPLWGAVLLIGVFIVAVTLLPGGISQPIAGWKYRVAVLTAAGLATASPAFVGIALVRLAVAQVQAKVDKQNEWGEPVKDLVNDLNDLRARLQYLLICLGIIIGAVTFSTGGLRLAVTARPSHPSYPAALPLVNGAVYTALIAAVYIPSYVALQRCATDLVEKLYPLQSNQVPAKSWEESRAVLQRLLRLEKSAGASLQSGLAILTPLITSIFAVLLPGK